MMACLIGTTSSKLLGQHYCLAWDQNITDLNGAHIEQNTHGKEVFLDKYMRYQETTMLFHSLLNISVNAKVVQCKYAKYIISGV